MYVRNMASCAHNDKLLIHFFQDSLTGVAQSWYMHLEPFQICCFRDMAEAFIKQYKYNVDMALDRSQLQNMSKRNNETFKTYAQRWKEIAAQVEPPLTEKEMVAMFIETLQAPFYDRIIGSVSSKFSNIVIIGERIEDRLRSGRIEVPFNPRKVSVTKKKDEEKYAVTVGPKRYNNRETNSRPLSNPPVSFVASVPVQPAQSSNQNANTNQIRPFGGSERRMFQFDPIPMSYLELLSRLISKSALTPVPMRPIEPPYPAWYNPDAKFEYHLVGIGHSRENCRALKFKVQDLINSKWLTFQQPSPSVGGNPLPSHRNQEVNFIEVTENCVNALEEGMPLEVQGGSRPTAVLLKPLVIYYTKKSPSINMPEPITIQVTGSFQYKSNKAIPWKYEAKICQPSTSIDNISEVGSMTQSGRIYAPVNKEKSK